MKITKIFDLYLFRNVFLAMIFIAITLAFIIFLTQSLRFLELVVEAGASSSAFWVLTVLALPRFFVIILPLSIMAAVLFVYNRMMMDSELVVMRATGASPLKLAAPALILALIVTVFLWVMSMWVAPASLSKMQQMRQVIKSQFSTLLFREGIFNSLIPGLTVYIREKADDGELRGLLIHDSRKDNALPSTTFAQRGMIISGPNGHEVLVYDGARQEFDTEKKTMNRLNFERYTIDLPDSNPIRERWREPDERTFFELLKPDKNNVRDLENTQEFLVEIHKRITNPLLALVFTMIALNALLLGPLNRRGMSLRIVGSIALVVLLQGLFLVAYNIARNSHFGLLLMYALIVIPLLGNMFFLMGMSENFRRKFFYKPRNREAVDL